MTVEQQQEQTSAADAPARAGRTNIKKKNAKHRSRSRNKLQREQQPAEPKFVEKEVSFVPPPNSLPALQHAVEQHATGVQVQVRLCSSGELVLFGSGHVGDLMQLAVDRSADQQSASEASVDDEKWEDNPPDDEDIAAQAEKAAAAEETFKQAYQRSLLLDEQSFAARAKDGVESFTLNELRCLTYKADPTRRARIITVEECVEFCREHQLRIIFDVAVAKFGSSSPSALSFSAWQQRRTDRKVFATQLGSLYTNNQLDALRFLRSETMVVGSDPFLLYRIRDAEQKTIPVAVVCEPHIWTGRTPAAPKRDDFCGDQMSSQQPQQQLLDVSEQEKAKRQQAERASSDMSAEGKSSSSNRSSNQTLVDDLLDRAYFEINQRLTPWIVGASCVSLHRNCFTIAELQKWRQREMLVLVTGFSDDPYDRALDMSAYPDTSVVVTGNYIKFFPSS